MNKDEVLKRAQHRSPYQMDEMEQDILQKGCRLGILFGLIVCLVLMGIKCAAGLPFSDVYSVYCFIMSGLYLYRWLRLKNRRDLAVTFLWGTVALVLCISYIVRIF